MGITSMIHLDIEIDASCNSHEHVMVLNQTKYSSPLIVLAEIASAKVLIFVLALAVALAIASATRN